jgi:hypothetical protein
VSSVKVLYSIEQLAEDGLGFVLVDRVVLMNGEIFKQVGTPTWSLCDKHVVAIKEMMLHQLDDVWMIKPTLKVNLGWDGTVWANLDNDQTMYY